MYALGPLIRYKCHAKEQAFIPFLNKSVILKTSCLKNNIIIFSLAANSNLMADECLQTQLRFTTAKMSALNALRDMHDYEKCLQQTGKAHSQTCATGRPHTSSCGSSVSCSCDFERRRARQSDVLVCCKMSDEC
jgi:hypothetical protein